MFKELDICIFQNLKIDKHLNGKLCVFLYQDNDIYYVYYNNEKSTRSLNIHKNNIIYANYPINLDYSNNNVEKKILNLKKHIIFNNEIYIIRAFDNNIKIFTINDCYLSIKLLNKFNDFWNNNKIFDVINDNPFN